MLWEALFEYEGWGWSSKVRSMRLSGRCEAMDSQVLINATPAVGLASGVD